MRVEALNYLWWSSIGAPLANHLWQSTLIAGFAYLIAVRLRPNRAPIRHVVWVMASAKFLIPFSLLVAVGTHIGSIQRNHSQSICRLAYRAEYRPTILIPQFGSARVSTTAMPVSSVSRVLPVFLLAIWCSGCFYVLFRWWSRLRRIGP